MRGRAAGAVIPKALALRVRQSRSGDGPYLMLWLIMKRNNKILLFHHLQTASQIMGTGIIRGNRCELTLGYIQA